VNFHLYDSMGQEKYRMLTSTFYSKANLVFLVFDVAQRESFENLKKIGLLKLKDIMLITHQSYFWGIRLIYNELSRL